MISSKKMFSVILGLAVSFSSLSAFASMQVLHDMHFPQAETSTQVQTCNAENPCEKLLANKNKIRK